MMYLFYIRGSQTTVHVSLVVLFIDFDEEFLYSMYNSTLQKDPMLIVSIYTPPTFVRSKDTKNNLVVDSILTVMEKRLSIEKSKRQLSKDDSTAASTKN